MADGTNNSGCDVIRTDISCKNGIVPFERNSYFFGKLLTVDDFKTEQHYFMEKARVVNRTIHGAGVVYGLGVSGAEYKEEKLSFELAEGVALDGCGNLIVVSADRTVTRDETLDEGTPYYLYLKYDECQKERVPATGSASSCEEFCCYNRVLETYDFDITAEAPAESTYPGSEGESCAEIAEAYASHLAEGPTDADPKVLLAVMVRTGTTVAVEMNTRTIVYNNRMLFDLLCNHMTAENPHKVVASVNGKKPDTAGEVTLKHADLAEVVAVDPAGSSAERIKHLSDEDAKKWDGAVFKINNKTPAAGNFEVKAGENVAIAANAHGITISAAAAGSRYMEKDCTLAPGASEIFEHGFGTYPNIDVYEVISVFTKTEIEEMAKEEGVTAATFKKRIGAKTLRDSNVSAASRFADELKRLNDAQISGSKNVYMMSSDTKTLVAKRVSAAEMLDDVVIAQKPPVVLSKVVGRWDDVEVLVQQSGKSKVKISNRDKESAITVKVILTA